MNAIRLDQDTLVTLTICITESTPSNALSGINIPLVPASNEIAVANVPNVAITFSFAIKPVIAATANTQPNEFNC